MRVVDWPPENLIITRFGLNADFIDEHGLTWIDNLETSSGGQLDDPEHRITTSSTCRTTSPQFGVKQVRGQRAGGRAGIGRQLCRDAILAHVPIKKVRNYEKRLVARRFELKVALAQRRGDET